MGLWLVIGGYGLTVLPGARGLSGIFLAVDGPWGVFQDKIVCLWRCFPAMGCPAVCGCLSGAFGVLLWNGVLMLGLRGFSSPFSLL